jgi:hypothetical protein
MTNQEYEDKLKKIKEKNQQIEMKQKLKDAKVKRFNWKKPNTSKLIVFVVFAISLQILWFSEHMISLTGDTSYMYALIGIPAALIPTVISYFNKAKIENISDSGYVYEARMAELNQQDTSDDEAVG